MDPKRDEDLGKPLSGWRLSAYTVIFEADTPAGRLFDQALIVAILASVVVVIADSVQELHLRHGEAFHVLEWGFTLLFTVEYAVRLACVRHPLRYATSFFGIVDLLSILPTYVAVLVPDAHLLIDVRILRLLRIFRVLKVSAYLWEYQALGRALHASRRKILVFLSAVMMLLGWGTLAVPTGIVTSELTARRMLRAPTTRTCHACLSEGHAAEADYCMHCGAQLPEYAEGDRAAPAPPAASG